MITKRLIAKSLCRVASFDSPDVGLTAPRPEPAPPWIDRGGARLQGLGCSGICSSSGGCVH